MGERGEENQMIIRRGGATLRLSRNLRTMPTPVVQVAGNPWNL